MTTLWVDQRKKKMMKIKAFTSKLDSRSDGNHIEAISELATAVSTPVCPMLQVSLSDDQRTARGVASSAQRSSHLMSDGQYDPNNHTHATALS